MGIGSFRIACNGLFFLLRHTSSQISIIEFDVRIRMELHNPITYIFALLFSSFVH